MNVEEVADLIFRKMEDKIAKALEPVVTRLSALEEREVPKSSEIIKEILGGDELATLVNLEVAEAVSEIEPIQGEKGDPGKDGENGKDGVGLAGALIDREGNLVVTLTSGEAKSLGPVTSPAQVEVVKGEKGDPGNQGDPGRDGIGLAGALIDHDGNLVITLTNGEAKSLGKVIGNDGSPGKDGADFTDADFDWDGERTIVIRGKGAEIRKTLPVPLDRGYYRDGMSAEKGDILTHNGSAWIALRETKSKPCYENKEDWRLFARRGQDGKDGVMPVSSDPVKLHGN